MKKLFWVLTLVIGFAGTACHQEVKTDEQIDSLNQAKDNVATDSVATTDSIVK